MTRPVRRQLIAAGVLVALLVAGFTLSRLGRPPTREAERVSVSAEAPTSAAGARVEVRRDRTAAGARAAAFEYAAGVQQRVVYQPDGEARAVLAGWMAAGVDPAELDRTAVELESTRKALMAARGQVWWVVSPLAAKVGSFTEDRAKVSVWLVRVLASGRDGSGGYVPTSGWLTATVDLVWEAERGWSVWSVASTPGPVPGPTVSERPSSTEEFVRALDGFSLVEGHG